jgi:hypothetical protein
LHGRWGGLALFSSRGQGTAADTYSPTRLSGLASGLFMRLTLRTLLAYLDDVLDPADKEELSQKIQSSDFAEDLVHRTRDTVRRLRLSAPQLIGTGMGLDPNSVAEYLDNVMPPDAVGDFERICLESDVHLAEAAACHHVLTMILGQPADIDPIARQRMYTIVTEAGDKKKLRIEPAHVPSPMAASVAVATPGQPVQLAEVVPAKRKVEIPEYLRAGAWSRSWGVLAGLAAVVIVGIAILFASGLRGWFGKTPSVAALTPESAAKSTESETPSPVATSEPAATNTPAEPAVENTNPQAAPLGPPPQPFTPGISPPIQTEAAAKSGEPDRYAVPAPANNNPPATPVPPPVAPAATPAAVPANGAVAANPADDKKSPADNGAAPGPYSVPAPASPNTQPAPGSTTVNVPVPPVGPPPAATSPLPPESAASAPPAGPVAPDAGAVAATATPDLPATLDADGKIGAKPPAPAGPPELGTYIGGKTVLLRYDGKTGAWFRVEPRAAVVAGETILSLPEFRPKVAMVSGLHLDLSGGTAVTVEGEGVAPKADAESAAAVPRIPSVDVVYGRIVLVNPTDGEKRVRLKLGGGVGEAQLGRNAMLAVEVERKHVPGADPRKAPAPAECWLYAPDGGVVWKDGAGVKTVNKASRWTIGATGATDPVADTAPPEWIYHEPIGQMSEQRYGTPKIESTLVSNMPADVQLLEMFQGSKQKEVKSLVTRSSIHVGLFEPFVKALGDSDQKAYWKSHIDALRAAMALSPESANKVWQTLVDQRGRPAAADLFEMLCGYNADAIGHTPEQMKTGAIAQLIDRLEDNSLDYRVLAVHDLAEITGKRLLANPAANQAERTLAIRKWRARLEPFDLKPISPPQ